MTLFEWFILRRKLIDINAQPTMFHRSFFEIWSNPPTDFSLDLFAYAEALRNGLEVRRFPVEFGQRGAGIGHNDLLVSKLRYSKRTFEFSLNLARRFGRK